MDDFPNLSFIGKPKDLMNYIGSQICEDCLGTGIVYRSVNVKGFNTPPGGYWDSEPEVCHCQRSDDWQDRTEEV